MITNVVDDILIYENVLSDDFCEELIEAFESKIDYVRHMKNAIRDDYALQLDAHQSLYPFRDKIKQVLRDAHHYFGEYYDIQNNFDFIMSPSYKMQKSTTGGGFTYWHHEQGSDMRMVGRFAVWMFYLNDGFQGGTTDFKMQEHSFVPKRGTLLVWPAAYTHIHRGAPDLIGTKYILTGWWRYPIPEGAEQPKDC